MDPFHKLIDRDPENNVVDVESRAADHPEDLPGGRVDGFTCAIGTGGTLAGVGTYLKQRNPAVVVAAADPQGAAIYSWIKTGEQQWQPQPVLEPVP